MIKTANVIFARSANTQGLRKFVLEYAED